MKKMNKETIKNKCEELKGKAKQGAVNAAYWARDNKEILAVVLPIAFGGLKIVSKIAVNHSKTKGEKEVKELYCYDRSLGHYWRLKRDLSNKEWLDVDRRKRSGESLSEILSEMKVLK